MTKNCQQQKIPLNGHKAVPCTWRSGKRIFIFFLFFLFIFPLNFSFAEGEEPAVDDSHFSPGIRHGERLFYGLIDGKFEGNACANCHNTVEIDTFNWNPNAWEIAYKYKLKSTEEFTKAVMSPAGKKP